MPEIGHRPPPRAVLLPGTGSDADFVRRAFGKALAACGIDLVAVEPDPVDVVAGYRAALDAAARDCHGALLVGGVSLGATVAAGWAREHPGVLSGLLVALPAWLGEPGDAPAALSARFSARRLREHGLEAVLAEVNASTPPWLSAELSRAWRRQWPALPTAMDHAATAVGPTATELAELGVPTGVAGAVDDPVHPLAVAQQWVACAPAAVLDTVTLAELGADPGVLGTACVRAWQAARAVSAARAVR
ncbi:alpha/beta hydrolase [Rhodococcus sp. X156]|uniref:alpha/beta hydrolase n=1 Tax=Rhodococcus sp. X156 TaxID=2499145 RepID=UPI000FD7B466|nr:alpha/beta hydrolase [Rhodococcus sp. X156]